MENQENQSEGSKQLRARWQAESEGNAALGLESPTFQEWLEKKFPQVSINDQTKTIVNQAGEDYRNIARMSLLLAGLPFSVPGETVNRLCASGMSSVIHAHRAICAGDGDLFIAGGVENMTRGPWVISKVSKAFGRDAQMHDSSLVGDLLTQK